MEHHCCLHFHACFALFVLVFDLFFLFVLFVFYSWVLFVLFVSIKIAGTLMLNVQCQWDVTLVEKQLCTMREETKR